MSKIGLMLGLIAGILFLGLLLNLSIVNWMENIPTHSVNYLLLIYETLLVAIIILPISAVAGYILSKIPVPLPYNIPFVVISVFVILYIIAGVLV